MKRLLFLAHRVPYPPDKGERLRAYHEITALSEHFDVTVATLAHSAASVAAAKELGRFCRKVLVARSFAPIAYAQAALGLLGGRSATEGYFRSRRLIRLASGAAAEAPFDVAVGYCSGMLDTLMAVPATARVLDLVDVDSAKWDAYAARGDGLKSLLYDLESRRVAALEQRATESCDAVLVVSEAEAKMLAPGNPVVHAIGNGVDLDYFTPGDVPEAPAVVFTGTMNYRPNVEGVCWFVRDVWPQVRRSVPNATFTIVGRDPTKVVRDLERVDGVHVTGTVADVRPYLAEATVAVAPLHIARGVQNKVLEAMAAGKAVVSTPAAIEGLDVGHDNDVVVATTASHWVRCIVGLLIRAHRPEELGRRARIAVETHYKWSTQMAPLVALCHRLIAAAGEGAS